MSSISIRRGVAAGLGVAVVLAFIPTVHSQRSVEPAASASSAAVRPADSPTVVPFKIQVPDAVLTDLKQRMKDVRYPDELEGSNWDYGTNLAYLKTIVDYWRDTYDWRAQEKRFNQFDQFKTTIDGVEIYFIHQKSKNANATPLLLLNGWPSSIMEYEKVIGPLTDPIAYGGSVEDSFNVVIPSMPGFGFSGKPRERGYNPERIAKIWVQLMARLGYAKYAAHGSDWGSGIATRVALDDASHVMALHLAGCSGAAPAPAGGAPLATPPLPPPAQGINSLVNGAHNLGYQEIQSTKPQTLGFGLSDSPVGLASWILEKWYNWSDHDGDIEKAFTKDELLTNIMIYWVTNSGTSSSRIYFESRHMNGGPLPASPFVTPTGRVAAPTGCGAFPYQYDRRATPPNPNLEAARKVAETRFNIVHFTQMPHGGHFPAFEQPKLWVDDIRAFLATVRKG
jgi:epoxide hydrolase